MQTRRAKKHNAAEGTTKTKAKRTRRMDAAHTDSTTQQSESWECPISTRNHFISDKRMISSRRASLRSFNRFKETEITSPTCSQPQKISKKHDEVPKMRQKENEKVENSVAQVDIPEVMEAEVGEAEQQPLAETISKVQAAESELRHEETEKVGSSVAEENFRADTPELMGQEPLPVDIQASNNNHRRSTSTIAWSSQSFNLTKMVDMLVREDLEVDFVTQKRPMDTVDGYLVKPELMPILSKIRSKHGDIVRNCTAVAVKERSLLLEMICSVILQLQEKEISKISEHFLRRQIAVVNHLKNLKVETEWLHTKLNEMLDAREILNRCVKLKEKKDSNKKALENAESKLKECQKKKKEMETKLGSLLDEKSICTGTLKREMDESKRIAQDTKYVASKVRRFINYSAVDDLL